MNKDLNDWPKFSLEQGVLTTKSLGQRAVGREFRLKSETPQAHFSLGQAAKKVSLKWS